MDLGVISYIKKVGALLILSFTVLMCLPSAAMAKGEIPAIAIHLGETKLEIINNGDKSVKYPNNTVTVYDAKGNIIFGQGGTEIKGRGNTTWNGAKKPYQIKFEQKLDLFGLGKSKKWVLLANYYDPSQIRNDLALAIARGVGMTGTTDGAFVELSIDNEDLGLYYICHKVEIGASTLDLKDEGGVLFEVDQYGEDEDISFVSVDGDHFNLQDSVSSDVNVMKKSADLFEQRWNRFAADAKARNWSAVSSEIDVDSFAKYYLLNELGMNLDATLTSFFTYMDGEADVIHAGPAWDFDMCFGNRWGRLTERMWAYQSLHNDPDPNSHILMTLLDIPEFRRRTEQIWREEMRQVVLDNLDGIDEIANSIRSSALKNNAMWAISNYDDAITNLKVWVWERVRSLDSWFGEAAFPEEGNYIISAGGAYLTATGLSSTPVRVKLIYQKDGFWLITSPDKTSYLTGTARTSQYYSTPIGEPWQNANSQEWMIQDAGNGKYRFFNKDSGLYLRMVSGFLQEGRLGDGISAFDLTPTVEQDELVQSFVKRLYSTLLDREVDRTGLENWSKYLFSGTPAAKIISGITNSPEFLSRKITDTDYVRMLYRALLGREAQEKEIPIWLNVLNQGYTRKKLIEGISGSDEYVAMCDSYQIVAGRYKSDDFLDHNSNYLKFVARLYVYGLGRKWDEAGLRGWVQRIVDGKSTPGTVAAIVLGSPEMKSRHLSNEEFIRAVYLSILNREPDQEGKTMWKLALDIGYDRDRMVQKVVKSGEFTL